ncbi:hypothetical protein LSH36_193g12051 [Paralvinella palmiformis]|uniref:Uncharacterized protein n=1 Tax=Paralvinella palmiformis TaxID=53620 RepID=A0AAD9JR17_9ANNE|nr:hypothetical protein LSH36_193g12051 [Paralvinella palmiformis]
MSIFDTGWSKTNVPKLSSRSVLLGSPATQSAITTDHDDEDIVERIARRRRERQERLAKLSADTSSVDYDIEKRRQERRAARENIMR